MYFEQACVLTSIKQTLMIFIVELFQLLFIPLIAKIIPFTVIFLYQQFIHI